MPPADLAAALAALARQQDRADRRMDKVVEQLTGLAGDLARVARAKNGPGGGGDEEPEVLPSWLLVLDDTTAVALLHDLIGWVDAVYLRWDRVTLPTCWLWHPDMVEELLALRGQHEDAYAGPRPSWKAVGDWMDRRAKVVERLAPLQTCELDLHRLAGERDRPAPSAALRTALELIAHDWALAKDLPTPTEDQLHQAQRHHLRPDLPTQF